MISDFKFHLIAMMFNSSPASGYESLKKLAKYFSERSVFF